MLENVLLHTQLMWFLYYGAVALSLVTGECSVTPQLMWFLHHGDMAQLSWLLENVLLCPQQVWFLHDGAMAHFVLAVWKW